jgi:small subunit ribosomal protein S5
LARINPDTLNLESRPIRTNKCQKTTKGGRTLSWSALVIVGDRNGHVGCGIGKARAIPDAIRKGEEAAKKSLILVPLIGGTIPHELVVSEGAAEVMLKPASAGTGIVAGSSMRTILELAGVHDVLGKSLGSANAANIAWATIKALKKLKRVEEVASLRSKTVDELTPWVKRVQETSHVG